MKCIYAVIISLICLSGCSTVDGLGKDISSAAQWTRESIGGSK